MTLHHLTFAGGLALAGCAHFAAAPSQTNVAEPPGVVVSAPVADTVPKPLPPARDTARRGPDPVPARVDSARVEAAVIDSAAATVDVLPELALDQYATRDRVNHYVKLFAGDARDRVAERLSAGTRYDGMIRAKLRAAGIPEQFTYLAMIESGYNVHDYSSAAAVGMWQFMAGTARDMGLRVDWWIDERRDAVRSTDAAIKFLNALRQQFGSYYLAAAAYDGGPGRISRGLSRLAAEIADDEPEDKFFTLAEKNVLRAETREYVPQLIAAAIVGRDPASFGVKVDTQPPFVFDSVNVPHATSVNAVARACDADAKTILDYNGQVLRGMTPPDGPGVWMRVPVGCASTFDARLAAMDDSLRSGVAPHSVKKGETMLSLARKAGMTVTTLRRYNPKIKTPMEDWLPAGSKVLVPTKATLAAARDVPDPSIERYGVASRGSYVVKKGDTLGKIAERNHTTVAAIKRVNNLKSNVLQVGQKLRIPS